MSIESEDDLLGIQRAGRIVAQTLRELKRALRPGITTAEMDDVADACIARLGGRPAPRLIYGFPGAACISVNNEVVHGVPGKRKIRPGDLVKLDVTVEADGYFADAAITVPVSPVQPAARRLCISAEAALRAAIAAARTGACLSEIGQTVERIAVRDGFSVLPELSGHGIGRTIHEEPERVPNFHDPSLREPLTEGLVLAIEPMFAAGGQWVKEASDGWTVKTKDGSLAAHFEHTVIVGREGGIIVTA